MKDEERRIHAEKVRMRFDALRPVMDERVCRLWAGAEAEALGWGGIQLVSEATGLARSTVQNGVKEIRELRANPLTLPPERQRIRRPGAGRPSILDRFPGLSEDLEALVDPQTRGDPESPLRWTCKSTRTLAKELKARGHDVSHVTVGTLLRELDYSLQSPRKMREGTSHRDRNAQFEHLNSKVEEFMGQGQPVISVDTKKKELIGDFHNGGREYQPKGQPEPVRTHDFPDKQLGKGIPYGVYDEGRNEGWVSVGVDHDTAEFAMETIRRWWKTIGSVAYPEATKLLITADSGGSNSSRSRLWPTVLQEFADETQLEVSVCHYPPGTSKWNKIEHRMFSRISGNWRGRPLTSREVMIQLIANTTTTTGLRIHAELDPGIYPTGLKVSDDVFEGLQIQRDGFHGEWNYTITPSVE
ncbi:MAG: ISAzo13 family transposase [bacterium]|nr:ISAzo13 family transposase [bacterium]